MADEQPKKQVGQYYLMEKIAQGGMAEIFKGLSYDVHGIKKTVCIKKILPHIAASREFIDSLINEAKIAVKLVHGNIAQTYDLGKVGDDYFMVMEYVDGKSLSQINKRCSASGKTIPIPYLVYFVSEILSGLDYMHRRNDENGNALYIVHRDISPQNIMVSYSGTVKIIDFGIAKSSFKMDATDLGILKGKFAYMSPEQAYGDSIDCRSDIFSVGVILHEMLTGKRLFKAADSRETIRNVRRAKITAPSTLRKEIPEELDAIVLRSLTKDRRRRYPLASEMRDDLIKFLHSKYSDFKPSDAAQFVSDLFRDEIAMPEKVEADARTPHLIIDSSNSALADDSQFEITGVSKAPVDLSEYMLEETDSRRLVDEEDEEASGADISEEISEEISDGTSSLRRLGERLAANSRRIATFAIGAMIIVAVAAGAASFIMKMKKKAVVMPDIQPIYGEILVKTTPTDATVIIDGKIAGDNSPVTMRDVNPSIEHRIEVKKDGFIPQDRTISVKAGELTSVKIDLAEAGPPPASLELITAPAGAAVFIDDKETPHRTPVTIGDIEPLREYKVGLYLQGHQFWTKAVKLTGGQTKTFDIQLAKDYGSLEITSEPSGALVVIDELPTGNTPLTREKLEPGKIYSIDVWKDGYLHYTKDVQVKAGRKDSLRITLEKEMTPEEIEYLKKNEKKKGNR